MTGISECQVKFYIIQALHLSKIHILNFYLRATFLLKYHSPTECDPFMTSYHTCFENVFFLFHVIEGKCVEVGHKNTMMFVFISKRIRNNEVVFVYLEIQRIAQK